MFVAVNASIVCCAAWWYALEQFITNQPGIQGLVWIYKENEFNCRLRQATPLQYPV